MEAARTRALTLWEWYTEQLVENPIRANAITSGTLCAAAELLKKNGAKSVMAAVSHGVLNERGYERISKGLLNQLITTDSTPVEQREGTPITVLSVAELLGEGINRIHSNSSVTGLFDVKGF